ncbi:hypothetical protein CROQUDRAFT_65265 [Cronartium quercuum f. sp. fusiforme G11]|uniref:Uncharacterized protein n=1 Tax=Cronartium quercuum f. sp. fusiforme G11 TaxID=708437 RepID=A0A9P6NDZ3_9BASI|nr:hypothetical protein CROQUDRAFT_65265 [Cronartium quercuum f. sp. fusiforme G11]
MLIIEELKRLGLHALNPQDPGLTPPKVDYGTKERAIKMIGDYVKRYRHHNDLVTEGLTALRRIMHHDPIANKVGQDVLYQLLLSDDLHHITQSAYFDLGQLAFLVFNFFFLQAIQKEARESYRKFNIKNYMRTNKKLLSAEISALWRLLHNDKLKEGIVVYLMEQILSQRPRLISLDQWKLSIGIFFGLVQKAKQQKIDMFDMLYRFSDPKSLLAGDPLRLLISKEEKIIAEEACKALASQSSVLETRYKLLVTRDARKAFSMSDGEFAGFRAQLEISGAPELQKKAAKALSSRDSIQVDVALFGLKASLMNDIIKRNTWNDNFTPSLQLVFYFGKSLIRKDPEHVKNPLYQSVLSVLKSLSGLDATWERQRYVQEALEMLERLSKEKEPKTSSIQGASSHLNRLGLQKAHFEAFIGHILTRYRSLSENARNPTSLVRDTFLRTWKVYEPNSEEVEAVENLFKPSSEICTDERYKIIDYLKTLINQPNADLIRDGEVWSCKSWIMFVILNFAAVEALGPSGRTRFFNHVLEDFEDLTFTTSVLNQEFAKSSLKVLKGYLHSIARSVIEKEVELYI